MRIRKIKASHKLVLLAVECNSRKVVVYKLFSLLRRLRLLRAVNYVSEQLKRQHYLDCYRRLNLVVALNMNSLALAYSRFLLVTICPSEETGDAKKSLFLINKLMELSERVRNKKKYFERWLNSAASDIMTKREERMQLVKIIKKLNVRIKGYYATSFCSIYNDSITKKTRVNLKSINHKVPPINQL
eukprot:TRINITY_DN15235_c0_g1_i2.p1 TRINITY_DN15235_c0_g1~~TRINITY_DN15235_c0_g1_i2.p1  ORF type:complete len:187 (+),score=34.02 TRINITY_DN15235_c0_g1_i2:98-658(+)